MVSKIECVNKLKKKTRAACNSAYVIFAFKMSWAIYYSCIYLLKLLMIRGKWPTRVLCNQWLYL
jgi:hypothetical protein